MDGTEVALAAIALAASTVAGLVWVLKYFAKTLSKDLQAHTRAAIGQMNSNQEMLRFMRNLNGKLEKAAHEKLKGE